LLIYSVDDHTLYGSGYVAGLLLDDAPPPFGSELTVCLDDKCSQAATNQVSFIMAGDVSKRLTQTVWSCDKIGSAADWEQAIKDTYVDYDVPIALQVDISMKGQCLTGACPSEEHWRVTDPEYSVSPYKEPDGSVESGAIAGVTVAGIVVLIAALYRTDQQARRYRTTFAKRMADAIDLRASMRQLSPEALANEFKKIDSESPGGNISKEAMWTFLSTDKAGDLSESDFNALFAAIDLDQSGAVEFLEFCTSWASAMTSTVQRGVNTGLWQIGCLLWYWIWTTR
jgi:hypothetical protein